MLDSLFTEAIRKKGLINEPIREIEESKIDLKSKWFDEKIEQSDSKLIIAAGDGSYNKKKYLAFNFYAVSAETLIYNPNKKEDKLNSLESVELDILEHDDFLEDRLRNMMSIFEKKTAIKTFNEFEIDYYLDDGSLLGDLIRPIPGDKSISSENKEIIVDIVKDRLYKEIESNEVQISSFKYKEEFKELFDDHFSIMDKKESEELALETLDCDNNQSTLESFFIPKSSNQEGSDSKEDKKEEVDEDAFITFLESIENLIVLKHLLENKKKIIAVSKTSSSNGLFYANIPDMAILDKFTYKEGFSKPYYRRLSSDKIKRDFPVENDFFREMIFTIFFARLKDHKNIIKIELPYYADEDDIRNILSVLKRDSTEGYPFLLKKAHKDVVISNQDMTRLSNIIGFLDKSGREMLN